MSVAGNVGFGEQMLIVVLTAQSAVHTRPLVLGIPSFPLGPSLKDHVEWPGRRLANPGKPAVANDLG
jgi:hypothetical protein